MAALGAWTAPFSNSYLEVNMASERSVTTSTSSTLEKNGSVMSTRFIIATVAAIAYAPFIAHAGTFTTLYSFTGGADGTFPYGPLLYQRGELYGTTYGNNGNNPGNGNVFKVNATSGSFKVIYSFKSGLDGAEPIGGVISVNGLF